MTRVRSWHPECCAGRMSKNTGPNALVVAVLAMAIKGDQLYVRIYDGYAVVTLVR
jgi:hypothetical protein